MLMYEVPGSSLRLCFLIIKLYNNNNNNIIGYIRWDCFSTLHSPTYSEWTPSGLRAVRVDSEDSPICPSKVRTVRRQSEDSPKTVRGQSEDNPRTVRAVRVKHNFLLF